ncbi:chromosome segregation protein SMC [Helcococcus ovis]|uniref:AAA family ATPase n=1 Tax=Helcococcus ovis TaxID=72026 RepID=UPI00106FAFE6|nr:AAA family ATPase [Helcococcus ovis]TFF68340.1 chromosome segregation protein SMC [Helcococcus ovis]WNZ00908.1 AAA family ATPase [Helcococcus ovis]
MSIKINSLELENVKRIKAIELEPSKNGLTIIGGNNRQGKTSILDSIAWVLGGNKYKPTNPKNDDSVLDPYLKLTLTNGLVVERKGKNSDLKVTDPSGQKAGQQLLDSFISTFALDIPKFMEASNLEKGRMLLGLIGLEEEFQKLLNQEQRTYNERYEIGRIKDQKQKYADELIEHKDVPREKISVIDLINEQQSILYKNGENQKHRENLKELVRSQESDQELYKNLEEKIKELQIKKDEVLSRLNNRVDNILNAKKTVEELKDESTEEIVNSINNIELINKKIDENLNKYRAQDEANKFKMQYDELSEKLADIRNKKMSLLKNANLPLNGLSIEDGELTFNGQKWDGMSSSEQLVVATSIVKALNPECGFVLMDKLEQLDLDTLKEFGAWIEKQDLQVIATRVSKGEECSVIIEDGKIENNTNNWKAGAF